MNWHSCFAEVFRKVKLPILLTKLPNVPKDLYIFNVVIYQILKNPTSFSNKKITNPNQW